VNLFKRAEVGTKVNVIDRTIKDKSGHRFHPGTLGVDDTILLLTKMNDLDSEADGIECSSNVLFGGDTDGAASVVEDSSSFHLIGSFLF
jgi:hypothetical protein